MSGGCDQDTYDALIEKFGDAVSDVPGLVSLICDGYSSADATATLSSDEVAYGLNTFFLIYGGALVFFMHAGFAMLCAGAIRSKNAMNILLQTVLDAAVSAIMWYLVGFGFAYGIGDNPNGFIGDAAFGAARYAQKYNSNWTTWFFQWAFATTATTIPAGSVAERFNFNAYLGYSVFVSGFVYPVVVHWAWCTGGWLGKFKADPLFGSGYVDFAGSGVVHMVGGFTGLCGAWLVGPRLGRFDADGNPVEMPGHSAILVVLGTLILWFGWYGFNPVSSLALTPSAYAIVAGRAAVTTTLSGAAGGLACLLNGFRKHKAWDLLATCNGVLCGFVSITAGCHVLEPWAAIIAGFLGGLWFDFLCGIFLKLKIDDPLGAAPMHGGCGMWGVLIIGFLAKRAYVEEAYGASPYWGAFYPNGGGNLLAAQLIGILVIIAWVCGLMIPFFLIFKVLGLLRIPPEQEEMGLDRSKHGGSAYNSNAVGDATMRNATGGSSVKVAPAPTAAMAE